jgi:hypothetical protein
LLAMTAAVYAIKTRPQGGSSKRSTPYVIVAVFPIAQHRQGSGLSG